MHKFINITDADGDVHIVNTEQLCACDIDKRENGLYNCTLSFCDNVSSFYLDAYGLREVEDDLLHL